MSKHSKWAKIKRAKGTADVKKGAIFTKLGNAITIAAREGGGDPEMNFKLRLVVDRARAANMPKDTIDRAIERGSGMNEHAIIEELLYEGFAPGGSAVLITVLTDNRNRTLGEIKKVFSEHGGTLGGHNSVSWMFQQQGVLRVAGEKEAIELTAIDAGADDIREEDDRILILTTGENIQNIKHALEGREFTIDDAGIEWIAKELVTIEEVKKEQIATFLETLDNLDDVQNVFTNANI